VEPGQEADLREKLLSMLKDPAELQRMGQLGRERVLSRYTWPHVVQRIRDALR
jgi:glycosyltransferase involved in cell wall biosynthesis